jgi:hypothetical protein
LFLLSFKELFASFSCCLSSEEVRIIVTKNSVSTLISTFFFSSPSLGKRDHLADR